MTYEHKVINEKRSFTEYTVSSPTQSFVIGFELYEDEQNIHVTLNNTPIADLGYTFVVINSLTIEVTPAIPSGVLRIQRETDIDDNKHKFSAGAIFNALSMDENFEQIRQSQQETRDGFVNLSNRVVPLVDGLEEALDQAATASQAAQEAATAAEEAAQTTRSASQIIDASGETQQQVNYAGGSKWHSRIGGYKQGECAVLTNGDIVKSTVNDNTNDPNVEVAGWLRIGSVGEVESISELLSILNPKNGSRVYVKSYHAGLNKGGKSYIFDSSKSSINDGGLCINGWRAEYRDRYTIEDFGGVCDFNLDTNTGYDNAEAIKLSLAALDYALFTANAGTSEPIVLKSGQSLFRTNTDDYVAKTTNATGSGSNLAPNRSGVSDSYSVDAGIILTHEDNQYTTDVNIEIDIIHTSLSPNSIGIYAPRFYFCNFINKVYRYGTTVKTFDGYKSRVAVQAIATGTGFKWENDGSGYITGTTIDFSDSWVAFDTRYQTPVTGFDLYQLWYSTATNLAVDNGTNGITAYKFSNCKSLEFTGGAENNKGCLIDCLNSSVTFDGFKTAAHTGDNDPSNATIKAVSSTLNMNNSNFSATIGASGMRDIICSGSDITFSNTPSKPNGAGGDVVSNGGSVSEHGGLAYKIKLREGVFQIRDHTTQKRNITLTGYNGIFKVIQSTPLFLRLSITVSSNSGSIHKEIDILYLNSTTRDVKIVSTSTVGTISDFSLDFDGFGNVFLVTSGATSARFSIDCKDTYIQGEGGNFLDIY